MPNEDCSKEMPKETLDKIFQIAVGSNKNYKKLVAENMVDHLKAEAHLEHVRAMNEMIFDKEIVNLPYFDLELALNNPPLPVPEFSKVQIPTYNLEEAKNNFDFATFLSKIEVIKTLSKVRTECDRLASSSIFSVNITKTVKLDEFEQIQAQSLTNMKAQLKDRYLSILILIRFSWIVSLKNAVRNGFKDVGKGWFNMQESNMEVYKISKLYKFMNTVKFIMQDTLRTLILNSLHEYVKQVAGPASQTVTIQGTNDVKITESNIKGIFGDFGIKKPLFLIDIVFKFGTLQYNMDLSQFETTLVNIFDKSFVTGENLPQLEPLVLDQIFWAAKPVLQNVHPKDGAARKYRSKLIQAVRSSITKLEEYLGHFSKHLKILNLDIAQFALDYEASDKSLDQMEQDIVQYAQEWDALEKDIPSYISLGLFYVSCENVRQNLRKDLGKIILDLLAKKASKLSSQVIQSFSQIQVKLKERPTKIEELMDLRQYMALVPDMIRNQQSSVNEMLKYYEALEKHRYEYSNEDFKAKWNAFAWPSKIEELLVTSEQALVADEQVFFKSLQTDQEVFKDRLNTLNTYVVELSKQHDISRINEMVAEVNHISAEIKEAQAFNTLINTRERLFNLEPTKYDDIVSIPKEFEMYKSLWLTANEWVKCKEQWLNGNFLSINAEEVEKTHFNGSKNIFKSLKAFKNSPGCYEVAKTVKEEMDEFKPNIPLIQALRNPGMRERHWIALSDELGIQVKPSNSLTLTELLQMNLLEKIDTITKVCDVAGKEYSIETALDKMDSEWQSVQLEFIAYKTTGTYIMKPSEEITRMLDDHIVMTQSMAFSPYKKPFAERIALWENTLKTMQEVLDAWMTCQRSWLYLEPIFASDDIVTQLPVESKRFQTMDRTWRKIMNQSKGKPGAVDCCADVKLLDSFKECNKLLELVAKGLSAYLESKRISFPRFFFLSDDELLQILSQTKDPTAVQPHLRKCFENVASIEFGKDNIITAMFSGEGEKIPMAEPFYPVGPVEEWLLKVEDGMRKSVKKVIRDAIHDYSTKDRTGWVLRWPGQAILSGSQTFWTQEVTEALRTGPQALKDLYSTLLSQLQGLVGLVRGELAFLSRLVLGDLIVIDVHSRDVVKKLIDNSICNENDFEWISQLRSYWEDEDLRIKIVNANFK